MSMSSGDKITRMEAEVRAACDTVQKASAELECMRAREALKRRCAILNTRIESLQVLRARYLLICPLEVVFWIARVCALVLALHLPRAHDTCIRQCLRLSMRGLWASAAA